MKSGCCQIQTKKSDNSICLYVRDNLCKGMYKKFRASLFTDDLQPCHICGGTVYVLRGVGYYYVKSSRCHKHSDDPEFKPTLNDENIYFFDSTIEEEGPNRSDFIRYFTYYKIITG